MTPGLKHALFDYWWAWDHEAIRNTAVLAGFVPHFVRVVEDRFEANRSANPPRLPHDWKHFEVFRTYDTILRLRTGKGRHLTFELLLGLAAFLHLDPGTLFPQLREWIAEAAYYLAAPRVTFVESEARKVVGFDRADARVYADAVLSHPPSDKRAVTQAEIDDFLAAHPPVVRAVAEKLGPCLAAYHAPFIHEATTESRR